MQHCFVRNFHFFVRFKQTWPCFGVETTKKTFIRWLPKWRCQVSGSAGGAGKTGWSDGSNRCGEGKVSWDGTLAGSGYLAEKNTSSLVSSAFGYILMVRGGGESGALFSESGRYGEPSEVVRDEFPDDGERNEQNHRVYDRFSGSGGGVAARGGKLAGNGGAGS